VNVEVVVLAFICLFNLFYIPFIWCAHKIVYAVSIDTKMYVECSIEPKMWLKCSESFITLCECCALLALFLG
jgi:hypothetical protein